MAKQRTKSTAFWRDNYISSLTPEGKLLFDYCLSSPDSNLCGIYQCPLSIILADTGINKQTVATLFKKFEADSKIKYSDGWIAIRNRIKHQNINNPQISTGIKKELSSVPEFIKKWVMDDSCMSHENAHISVDVDVSEDVSIRGAHRFTPPTPAEVQAYLDEIGNHTINRDSFIDHYESKGWMIGKNKMKDWRAAVRTWVRRDKESGQDKKGWPML